MSGNKQTIDELPKISAHFARYLRAILLSQGRISKYMGARFPGHVGAGAVWMTGGGACAALVGPPAKVHRVLAGTFVLPLLGPPTMFAPPWWGFIPGFG